MTPWTVAHQSPLSLALTRQEYWSGLPFPSPGCLPGPGVEPRSPALAGGFFEPLGMPFITLDGVLISPTDLGHCGTEK